jgi:hypothetical protein
VQITIPDRALYAVIVVSTMISHPLQIEFPSSVPKFMHEVHGFDLDQYRAASVVEPQR